MYLNVNIVGGPSIKIAVVSVAELRAIQKDIRNKGIDADDKLQDVIATGDQYLVDIATEGDSELAQIASAGDDELSQIAAEGDSELAQIAAAGNQEILDVQAAGAAQVVIVDAEGDDQVARVRLVGDAQELIVTNEGDTQVARVIVYADEAEDYNGWADAEARNANAWANTPVNTDVINWGWDEITDTLTQSPIVGGRSALHWQIIAQTLAAGLQFQGTWDSVDCSQPVTPAPPPGELANGYFYIVASVTGDTALCPTLSIGDWIVWSGDVVGDVTVEGQWVVVDWTFDWSAITGVPENVQNALSRSGGTMTAPVLTSYNASAPGATELVARSYIDALAALFMPVNAGVPFTAVPRTTASQGTEVNELTKREFVDATFLKLAGGNMAGSVTFNNQAAINGKTAAGTTSEIVRITDLDLIMFSASGLPVSMNGLVTFISQIPKVNAPQGTAINELTRKDYVDTQRDTRVRKTSDTGSSVTPTGTEAQRDASPLEGYFRYNSDAKAFEGYSNGLWSPVGGGAKGGGNNDIFYENSQIVTENYTLSAGKNAMSAGMIEIADTITVTVPDGANWSVV